MKLGAGKFELFDLVADRNETKDVAASEPKVLEKMKTELAAWQH